MARVPFAVLTILAFAAPAMAAPPPDPIAQRGEVLVKRYCAGCHAVGASGRSRNPAAPPFRTLSERYPIDNLGEALAEGILTGHPAMPEFRFGPNDVEAVIRYLNSVQVRRAASLD